jgi:hypothetical protein
VEVRGDADVPLNGVIARASDPAVWSNGVFAGSMPWITHESSSGEAWTWDSTVVMLTTRVWIAIFFFLFSPLP